MIWIRIQVAVLLLYLVHVTRGEMKQRKLPNDITENYLDEDWKARAQEALRKELNKIPNYNTAKNVILFIGDGLGLTTTTVSRIYKGQKGGYVGELGSLSFEEFPHVALSKTFSNNMQVTASAAAAVALLSGQKTTAGTVGCGPKIYRGNCSQVEETKIPSILNWAMDEGKGTGVVSTTRITHATPAAAYAHSADRHWESDANLPDEVKGKCNDIAKQLILDNPNINVIMGGGRREFLPNTTADPEDPDGMGKRTDGMDLTQEWINDKIRRGKKHKYVWNEDQFKSVDVKRTDYLLGLFQSSHMNYELHRRNDAAGEPSLADMTAKAIHILRKQPKGFFLLVEGGRIDHAHHDNLVKLALEDTLAFDEAVSVATDLTEEKDTLIIVTADHSHPFTMGSWNSINNPVLGIADDFGFDFGPTDDGDPYLGLSYANGPGPVGRINATEKDSTADDFKFPVQVGMEFDTHGGEDVAIYARGPMSHLINGVKENQYITYVMAYAACLGDYTADCRNRRQSREAGDEPTGGSAMVCITSVWVYFVIILLAVVKP